MIRIFIPSKKLEQVKAQHLKDVYYCSESYQRIRGRLKETNAKTTFGKHPALYEYLYDSKGDPYNESEDSVKHLFTGSRSKLNEIIATIGEISNTDDQKIILNTFGYERFIDRRWAYQLLETIDAKVCPYCNRQYTYTIQDITRPQFDHFYPKSIYPYLSVSLFNLIPSCPTCNQSKASYNTYQNCFIYPYEDDYGDHAFFATDFCEADYENGFDYLIGKGTDFRLDIKYPSDRKDIEGSINQLHLKEIYSEHKSYISKIFRSFYIISDTYIEELLDSFPQLFSTKEDIMSLLLSTELHSENWGQKPLAKLTSDIYREIKKYSDG